MKALMKAKLLFAFLFSLNALNEITADKNEVHFDFNKNFYKVNIATNKPTVLPVTLYDPNVWPGPNDTFSTTTTTTPKPRAQRRRFVFGLRRSADDYKNRGYGYDNELHNRTSPPADTTISPFNRKFYTFDPSLFVNDTDTYYRNTSRQFPIHRDISSRRVIIPTNLSNNASVYRNISYYKPNVRKVIRRIPIGRNRTRNGPLAPPPPPPSQSRWQIFPNGSPRFNYTRDLGDFQELLVKDIARPKNFSGAVNDISIVNRTINTSFRCEAMRYYGYYADVESNCKFFHVCTPDGRMATFLCPNGLRFNQILTVCDWRENVLCEQSSQFYNVNMVKFSNWNPHILRSK